MSAAALVRRTPFTLLGAFLALVLLGWGAGEASEVWFTPADQHLLLGLDAHRGAWLTVLATALSTAGSNLVLLPVSLVVILLLSRRGRLADAIFIGVAVLGTVVLLYLVKDLVDRSRPLLPHLVGTHSPSFPSSHAGDSLAFYGGLALLLGRRPGGLWKLSCWPVAALIVLGVGWSRLYLGVHYPSDVLGGYLLAAAWLAAVAANPFSIKAKRQEKPRGTDPR